MKSILLAASLLLPVVALPAQPPTNTPNTTSFDAGRQAERRDLTIVLGLRPSQQAALATWLAAMRPPGGPIRREMRAATPQPSTTPQRLEAQQARIAERQQFETSRIAATKTFYGTLDGHQREVFDALERLRHGGHHGWRGRHGPDGGRPGPDMPPPPGARP